MVNRRNRRRPVAGPENKRLLQESVKFRILLAIRPMSRSVAPRGGPGRWMTALFLTRVENSGGRLYQLPPNAKDCQLLRTLSGRMLRKRDSWVAPRISHQQAPAAPLPRKSQSSRIPPLRAFLSFTAIRHWGANGHLLLSRANSFFL